MVALEEFAPTILALGTRAKRSDSFSSSFIAQSPSQEVMIGLLMVKKSKMVVEDSYFLTELST